MLEIQVLSKEHRRSEFDCGVYALNRFLHSTARQHADKGISKTFVAVEEMSPKDIIGFYTLTVGEVYNNTLEKKFAKTLPRNGGLPIIKLARLAVSDKFQNRGYGETLLFDCMSRAYDVSQQIGSIALFVDAKDQRAANFYQKYGFHPTNSDPLHLYIPYATIAKLL